MSTAGKRGTRFAPTQEQIVFCVTALLALGFAAILPGFGTVENLLTLTRGVAILGDSSAA